MIKSDFGKVQIKGDIPLIQAELSSIANAMYKQEILSKEQILRSINKGLKTDEEIHKEFCKKLEKIKTSSELKGIIENLIRSRISGMTQKDDDVKMETILDEENIKVHKVSMNIDGKSDKEIAEMLKNMFKGKKEDDI